MNTSHDRRYITKSHPPESNPSTLRNLSGLSAGGSSGPFLPQEYFTGNGNITNPPPPLPADPAGIYSVLISDRDLTVSKKKYVKVTGTSEIEVEPDRVNFVIQIKSIKPDVRDARASIKKREEYIVNVLKKHYIPETSYSMAEFVEKIQRLDQDNNVPHLKGEKAKGAGEAETAASNTKILVHQFHAFKLMKEINVNIDNLMKYLQISSLCTEKLDEQVLISQPVVKFSSTLLHKSMQQALRQAMASSQAKARELVGNYKHHGSADAGGAHLALGPLIYSYEDSLVVQKMEEYETTASFFETFKWKRFNQRISCQITSAFEIVHTKPKKYI